MKKDREPVGGVAEEVCQDGQGQPPGEGQQTEVILQGPRAIEGVWEPGPLCGCICRWGL